MPGVDLEFLKTNRLHAIGDIAFCFRTPVTSQGVCSCWERRAFARYVP